MNKKAATLPDMEDDYMNKTAKRCIFTILLVLVFYAVLVGAGWLRWYVTREEGIMISVGTRIALYFMSICVFALGTVLAAYLVSRKPVTRVQIGIEVIFIVLPALYFMCSFVTYLYGDKSIVAKIASYYEEYLSLAGTVIFTSWAAGIIRSRWINRCAGK